MRQCLIIYLPHMQYARNDSFSMKKKFLQRRSAFFPMMERIHANCEPVANSTLQPNICLLVHIISLQQLDTFWEVKYNYRIVTSTKKKASSFLFLLSMYICTMLFHLFLQFFQPFSFLHSMIHLNYVSVQKFWEVLMFLSICLMYLSNMSN